MKRCAEEVKQKGLSKNIGRSILVPSNNTVINSSYIPKPSTDYTNIQRTSYAPPILNPPVVEKKELKSFVDDEDEEVSVAFEELMTEIAKYESN